jgi:hypothetical protein
MRYSRSRSLAFLPAMVVAGLVVEVAILGARHRWISHYLVPSFWGLVFGLCAYGLFVWILSARDDDEWED